jgi:hypothetical protein
LGRIHIASAARPRTISSGSVRLTDGGMWEIGLSAGGGA